jgi:hypothetical protein
VEDLSLHILDIAENAVRADARNIEIILQQDMQNDLLRLEVNDDGAGMDAETLARVRDPFFTTKHKKTGLGIPLLAQAAEQAGGCLTIDSAPGRGTKVTASFSWSNVDRPAIGNMADSLVTLIAGHPELDFLFEAYNGEQLFRFDTREIKHDLEDIPINAPGVIKAIRSLLLEQPKFGP